MVNPTLIIVAAIFIGLIFIRKEIGEAGTALGQVGTGIGVFGKGIQTAISALLSPQIRPALVPTLGLQLELPDGLPGTEETLTCDKCVVADFRGRHPEFCIACLSNRPAAPDDRQGGRNINVGASGRQGLPPQPMVVPIGRLGPSIRDGAREPREQRVFQAGAFRIL